MMTILSLNINDFGGLDHHLQECKKVGYNGRESTDWKYWRDFVDKKGPAAAVLEYIQKNNPSIIFLQEFEVNNSVEPKDFVQQLKVFGYRMLNSMPAYPASITVAFARNDISVDMVTNPNTLCLRSCALQIGNTIILGTHVPPKNIDSKRIQTFWDELNVFYTKHSRNSGKVLIVGDMNTMNLQNRERYWQLLNEGAVDLWLNAGYADDVPTCGENRIDLAIASPALLPLVREVIVDPMLVNLEVADHAAVIVEMEEDEYFVCTKCGDRKPLNGGSTPDMCEEC